MNRKGFTLIELLMVIIIVSILAVSIDLNPVNDVDTVDNEYGELYQDLNYLKQLNLNQSFFIGNDATWINKSDCLLLVNANEYNLNNNGTILQGQNFDNVGFTKNTKSNITMVDGGGNAINRVCFDNMGRPYINNLATANIIQNDITISITNPKGDYVRRILIKPVTGYIQ